MIKTYRDKGLEAFATKGETRRLSVQNTRRLTMILTALNAATRPEDMNLPGLRWHPLGRMAPGRWAVEASGNWRVTYGWKDQDAIEVDLEDYH